MSFECLLEVWEVTEWKNGCIFKTRYVEDVWVPFDPVTFVAHRHPEYPNKLYVPKSSDYEGPTFR